MESRLLTRYFSGIAPLALLAVLLSAALFMMSAATQNSAYFSRLYSLLIVATLAGIVLLLALILTNVRRLVRQYRARVLGSRLTVRLLVIFGALAFAPVSVVYVFSLQVLNKGIDSWFDVKIGQALNDALALGRASLSAVQEDMLAKTESMALELEFAGERDAATLHDLREHHGVAELTVFAPDGKILASASRASLDETKSLVPERPSDAALTQVRQGLNYASIDATDNGLQVRVLVPIHDRGVGAPRRYLQLVQPLANRYGKLGDSVQSAYAEYEKLMYLRKPLKFGFALTLSLVALLTLLVALSTAMFLARRFVAPIRDLAEGTRAVAQGNYRKRIPVTSRDELGILVRSFNEMTRKIHRAQNQIRRSQREAEAQRTYLETVLSHLSSGVLSFDPRLALRMYNDSASSILGVDLSRHVGEPLGTLAETQPHLAAFARAIAEGLEGGRSDWRGEVNLFGERGRSLLVKGTSLPGLDNKRGGCVVVFDDMTALIQAQRDAAWGEVARRLAHEIKNPLTPIQLSAERIRHKFLHGLDPAARDTLDRATRTIIQQVDSMKSMVNDFADFARPVAQQIESVQLNDLVRDVVELHRGKREALKFELKLEPDLPALSADPRRLRQVLNNLLLNAGDAVGAVASPRIVVETRCVQELRCQFIELQVQDNGPGFGEAVSARLFEPYVTSKEKGTGLGLPIVKKIVEEHGGAVWAANLAEGGACITIRLPLRARPTVAPIKERSA